MLDKPFKTYDEQVEVLRDKYGLMIYDKGEAVKILATMCYYDLINGYTECFVVDENYSGEVPLNIYTSFTALMDPYKAFCSNTQSMLRRFSKQGYHTYSPKSLEQGRRNI